MRLMVVVITSCSLRREWPPNVCPDDDENDEEIMLVLSDFWQTNDGEDFISGASTGQTDGNSYTLTYLDRVLLVDVEGTIYRIGDIIANRQVQLDLGNNRIYFPIVFDGTQK